MMKNAFINPVCLPYCMFYKQGQKEEMACQGLRVIKILVESRQLSEENLQLGPKDRQLWTKHRRTLTVHVCNHCSFQAGDCDFQSPLCSEGMEPCGGYIVLSLLLENDLISPTMLESLS